MLFALNPSDVIGEGSFGQVYIVRSQVHAPIAVKAVKKNQKQLPEDMRREVEAGRKLDHKSIVKIHDVHEDDNFWYLIMEHIPGEDLLNFVHRKQSESEDGQLRLSPKFIKNIFKQLVKALYYCHKQGIAHLDIKLENIMIHENSIKLIDFGLCLISGDITSRSTTRFAGSVDYVSPEILKKRAYRADKADVWSLGVILYILFYGEMPYSRNEREEFVCKNSPHPEIKVESKTVPKQAQDLIQKMLKIDPRERITMSQVKKHPWLSRW